MAALRSGLQRVSKRFGLGHARSGALDQAIRLLLLAAQTGKRANIESATDQIERVLRDRCLI